MRLSDFEAVLFDMDGTLVDTEPLWHRAEIGIFAEHRIQWTVEQAQQLTGLNLPAAAELMRARGVALTVNEIIDQLTESVLDGLRSERAQQREQTIALLGAARRAELPTALVTASPRSIAEAICAQLPTDGFDTMVTAQDVTHGKPHPEPYLQAAERLAVAASDCLVIEDSRYGAQSGLAAGCTVLSVGPLAGQIDGAPALNDALQF